MSIPPFSDEWFMQRCLDLANQAKGLVSPNPMVGSVIVHKQEIIGEGYHHEYGKEHAEVLAIASVKDEALLRESTLYVNLEPCSHFGKTPPCSDLIVEKKIPRVVIGTIDPFSEVAGKGIEKLKRAGIEVKTNVLSNKCSLLNKRFFTAHKYARPFIVLKWAQTRDGFIDIIRNSSDPQQPTWITNEISRTLVHKWRTEEQAIMVGRNTAEKDNPKLDVRDWTGKNPLRIVTDRKLTLPQTLHIFQPPQQTLVINELENKTEDNIEYLKVDYNQSLIQQISTLLYERNITSLLVEGGKTLLQSFIDEGLWDEARVFIGNKFFENGIEAPIVKGGFVKETHFGNDTLFVYRNNTHVYNIK
jgi:diaminohydroxyphosphoribosylaminopyrimidine deaminase/5-amino-6-(5-phosphoribosylamino)uracil reductase